MASQRLDSWKEIAAYLKRGESTVRRWEKEGLPVRRHAHKSKASVYAYTSEIDVWWNDGRARLESIENAAGGRRQRVVGLVAAGLVLLGVGLALNVGGVRDRLLGRSVAGEVTSIAVLPLKNISGDPQQDYFMDGMTEALVTELGKISGLRVLSYQSVISYRQTAKPLPQIARELKVDALLEGAVLHSRDRVRITANLVQAVPERHLWAQTFEFDPRDVLAVQREVARDVARQIRIRLTPQERARLTPSRRVDPGAYEAYLLGRAYFYKIRTPTNVMRAKEHFEKAIERDPGYASAYASLAELYIGTSGSGILTRGPRDARLKARQWAEEALKLDDTLAEAHTALARVEQQEWDWAGAEREYQRAIELNPSDPLARIWYAIYLYAMQRFEEAVAQAERAQRLDPVSPLVNTWAGAAYFFAGRPEEAMVSWQKALELDPSYSDASIVLARTYVTKGLYLQAIAELQKALIFNPREPFVVGALAHAYARAGQREEALKLLGELKRIEAERGSIPTFSFIWAYAGLNDKEHAFAWLEKSYQERRDRMVWLNVDPLLDPLRPDPRFHELVRRVGLLPKSP
ncbi:MAG TPA: tetratricopeptide repeat protein [bacterium]|nr:tetratricopeptide repeat protein [bacterium]